MDGEMTELLAESSLLSDLNTQQKGGLDNPEPPFSINIIWINLLQSVEESSNRSVELVRFLQLGFVAAIVYGL